MQLASKPVASHEHIIFSLKEYKVSLREPWLLWATFLFRLSVPIMGKPQVIPRIWHHFSQRAVRHPLLRLQLRWYKRFLRAKNRSRPPPTIGAWPPCAASSGGSALKGGRSRRSWRGWSGNRRESRLPGRSMHSASSLSCVRPLTHATAPSSG